MNISEKFLFPAFCPTSLRAGSHRKDIPCQRSSSGKQPEDVPSGCTVPGNERAGIPFHYPVAGNEKASIPIDSPVVYDENSRRPAWRGHARLERSLRTYKSEVI